MSLHPYASLEPPCPELPVRIASPDGERGVLLPALVDTGADLSVLPLSLVRVLALPLVGEVRLQGFGGGEQPWPLYAAEVQVESLRDIFQVLAFGSEALLGRDVLNHLRLVLDGPRLTLEVPSR